MSLPKVLIACPTAKAKEYCTFDWVDNVREFTYPNKEIMLVDNSDDLELYDKLLDYGVKTKHIEKKGNAVQFVAASCNLIRNHALQNDFDYIMMVEIDNFPHHDIIQNLMRHQKPVVSAPYFLNSFSDTHANLGMMVKHNTRDVNIKLNSPNKSFIEFDGTLREYATNCIGCCLIHKSAFQRVRFRADARYPGVFHDTLFFMDCAMQGIKCYVDMSYICEHRRGTWKGNKDLEKQYA